MSLADRVIDRLLGLPPPRSHRLLVERDLRIPMPDGVVLLADRYRPPGAGPMPAVLVRTPYGRRSLSGLALGAAVARRGFQVVIQSVRGTSGSGGLFQAFRQEQSDGLATAAWLRAQPWCDGRLAMGGASYPGYVQWALAPYLEPPLAAMCPSLTTAAGASAYYPGGSFALRGALSWATQLARQDERRLGMLLPDHRQARRCERALWHLPLLEADTIAAGRQLPLWRELVGAAGQEDGWRALADHSAALAGLVTPVSMTTGWQDHSLPWQLRDFRILAEAGRNVRITVGPWGHSDLAATAAALTDQIRWLGTHLLGEPERPRAPVRIFLQQAGQWLDLTRWPPESTSTPVYLAPGGRLAWEPPPPGEGDRFSHDPAHPVPAADRRHADLLVYTGEPLPRDLDVAGEVRAVLHVHVVPAHADLAVMLHDVDPGGTGQEVCAGLVRLAPGDAADRDDVRTAVVELWPTGYRFRQGHRIRVRIAGGAFPGYARNHGTGEPIADAVRTLVCRYQVMRDPEHPSHLLLPVLSG
jgi:uncharacterized protein